MVPGYELGRFDDRRRAVMDASSKGARTLAQVCAASSVNGPAARERVWRTMAYLARHGVLVAARSGSAPGTPARRSDSFARGPDFEARMAFLAPYEAFGLVRQPRTTVARFLSARNVGTGLRRFMSTRPDVLDSWTVVDATRDKVRFEAEIDALGEGTRGVAKAALCATRRYVAIHGAFSGLDLEATVSAVVGSATRNVRLSNAVLNGVYDGVDLAGFLEDPTRLWANGIEPRTHMARETVDILKAYMSAVAIEEDVEDVEASPTPSWCREDIVADATSRAAGARSAWTGGHPARPGGRSLQ